MDYTIIKKGRKGYIRPFPSPHIAKVLDTELSFEKVGIEYMPIKRWGVVHLYNIKIASFPFGLLDKVLKILTGNKVIIQTIKKEKPIINLNKRLRPYQVDSVLKIVENNGGILCLPTGGGKTFVCLEFLRQYQQPALVICPTRYLVDQWQKQAPKYVDVRTYQGIKNYDDLKKYSIIVFDECHHTSATTIYKIAMKLDEQIVVGLSATPKRIDNSELKVFGALGQIVYEISLRELIDMGYLSDAEIELHNINNEQEYMEYQEIYKKYIVNNEYRNNIIIESCEKYNDKKILILVGEIEHGNILLEKLNSDSVFMNSKNKNPDFEKRIIIATSILDEGIDMPDREVIIMAVGGKSSIKVLQRIGRVLRLHRSKKKALIIDYIDRAKYLFEHYKKREEIYNEHGFKFRK